VSHLLLYRGGAVYFILESRVRIKVRVRVSVRVRVRVRVSSVSTSIGQRKSVPEFRSVCATPAITDLKSADPSPISP